METLQDCPHNKVMIEVDSTNPDWKFIPCQCEKCEKCGYDYDDGCSCDVCLVCDKDFIRENDLQICDNCVPKYDLDLLWLRHDNNQLDALDFNESAKMRKEYLIIK